MIHSHGYNFTLLGIFGKGPKWTFYCDACGEAWSRRLVSGVDNPKITCPCCHDYIRLSLLWQHVAEMSCQSPPASPPIPPKRVK